MPFTYAPFTALVLVITTLVDDSASYLVWSIASVGVVAWTVGRFVP